MKRDGSAVKAFTSPLKSGSPAKNGSPSCSHKKVGIKKRTWSISRTKDQYYSAFAWNAKTKEYAHYIQSSLDQIILESKS